MAKQMVHLTFPERLIKKPLIYQMALRYKVVPSIRRANITDTLGEVVLELVGTAESLKRGIAYLARNGVKVTSVVGDVVQ